MEKFEAGKLQNKNRIKELMVRFRNSKDKTYQKDKVVKELNKILLKIHQDAEELVGDIKVKVVKYEHENLKLGQLCNCLDK